MKYKVKDMTIIAITVALTFVFGWVFYLIANLFPIPGSKFVGVTVFSSFMLYFPVYKLKRNGIIFGVTAVLAGVMSLISILMGLAIISAGLMTELISWLFLDEFQGWKLRLVTGSFSLFGTLNSLLMTYYIAGGYGFSVLELIIPFIIMTAISFIGGYLGAYLAYYIIKRYLPEQ